MILSIYTSFPPHHSSWGNGPIIIFVATWPQLHRDQYHQHSPSPTLHITCQIRMSNITSISLFMIDGYSTSAYKHTTLCPHIYSITPCHSSHRNDEFPWPNLNINTTDTQPAHSVDPNITFGQLFYYLSYSVINIHSSILDHVQIDNVLFKCWDINTLLDSLCIIHICSSEIMRTICFWWTKIEKLNELRMKMGCRSRSLDRGYFQCGKWMWWYKSNHRKAMFLDVGYGAFLHVCVLGSATH